jgi:hypothetical protein
MVNIKSRGSRVHLSGNADAKTATRHAPGAFSSEVVTGSRQENASNQESGAPFRFHRNGL